MQDELGKGAFGSVRLAKDKQTGQKVAIKTVIPVVIQDPQTHLEGAVLSRISQAWNQAIKKTWSRAHR